jgi:hypothetical protein
VADIGEEIALGAVRRFGRELGIERRLLGEFAVGDELHGAGHAQRRAIHRTLRLRARAHPLVVPGHVPQPKFHIVNRAILQMTLVGHRDGGLIVGVYQIQQPRAREPLRSPSP